MTIRLGSAFEHFAAECGYEVTDDGDHVTVANAGGEIRFAVEGGVDCLTVTRAERAEDPAELLRARELDDVVRFLVEQIGVDLRAARRYPWLLLPYEPSDLHPGFAAEDVGDDWTRLTAPGRAPVEFARASMHPEVSFSHLAVIPVDELIASYRDPAGAPALTRFVA